MAQKKTLNPRYNDLLVRWGNVDPECEECGKDLSGCMVHDMGIMWVGDCCKGKVANIPDEDYRQDERKQMGIGS